MQWCIVRQGKISEAGRLTLLVCCRIYAVNLCVVGMTRVDSAGVLSAQLDALQKMTGTASNGAVTGFINNSTSIVTGVFKRGTATYGNTTAQDPNYQGWI
jgi:hypothetical protein